MQEWMNAIVTTEWLLGASMALAGKKALTWIRDVREEFANADESDSEVVENQVGK